MEVGLVHWNKINKGKIKVIVVPLCNDITNRCQFTKYLNVGIDIHLGFGLVMQYPL